MKAESKMQQEIVTWYRNKFCLKHHEPRHLIFSVPNERKDVKELMFMKATGLFSGVSDLIVVQPDRVVFVECKDEKGRQSSEQIDFENAVTSLGFEYILVRSLDEFQEKIKKNQ